MWWDRRRPWMVVVPGLTAGLLMVLFFWLTNRWDNLENPVQSQVTLICGIIGFSAALAIQRITRWELVLIPGAVAIGVLMWAILAPNDSQEDREFRQILTVLAVVLLAATLVMNIPQIARGRRPADSEPLT